MSPKLTSLLVFILISFGVAAQMAKRDSAVTRYDTVSTIPQSLLSKIDTSKKTLVGQTLSTDTTVKNRNISVVADDSKPAVKKMDRRWFISPLLKFQAQEFGMLEKQRRNFESDAHLLSFPNKSNISVAASVYKNFTKNVSMSVDLGLSMGHVTSKDSLIATTKRKTYNIANATLYYHLLGGHYKLQPFIAAGINNVMKGESYTSAPVGAGVKYTGQKLMIEAQGAYGYALSKNIANTLVYSLGIYIPLGRKEKQRKEKENAKKDSAAISITNIINNYYLLNNSDSVRKTKVDSVGNQTESHRKIKKVRESAREEMDADDPMRLPAARKYTAYFYYDEYALTTSAFNTIDVVISKMKENKNLNVHLKGHTDMTGSEQYNAPLSTRRAQMVADYMNSRGISSDRIVLSGYGKKSPAVMKEDRNTAWMNRRCEMVLFEKRK